MVRIDLGGKNLVDLLTTDPDDIPQIKTNIRRRMKGGRTVKFEWQTIQPRLVLTSDTDDFDETLTSHFQAEGFQITYLAYEGDHKKYMNKLAHVADDLELGETYAIVAYGDAAALCLETCIRPAPKLAALVAYYPPYMPKHSTSYPSTLPIQIHLPGSAKFGTRQPSFRYPDTEPGFAEHDLDEYDKTASTLAWSRTLGLLRRSFQTDLDIDLEKIWDHHCSLEFSEKDAEATMKTMVPEPYVNHVPTMTGGIGSKDLYRFYRDYFIPGNPESLKIKLLSRTVGVDRVVDEMLCTFRHSCEVPWMLPGIPPTDKSVEVVLVSVVCIRGGKLYHEHIHWDQATVLVQVGLLDPKYVPKTFKTSEEGREKEVNRLPVVGREGARKVVDETLGRSNDLIPGWFKDDDKKQKKEMPVREKGEDAEKEEEKEKEEQNGQERQEGKEQDTKNDKKAKVQGEAADADDEDEDDD